MSTASHFSSSMSHQKMKRNSKQISSKQILLSFLLLGIPLDIQVSVQARSVPFLAKKTFRGGSSHSSPSEQDSSALGVGLKSPRSNAVGDPDDDGSDDDEDSSDDDTEESLSELDDWEEFYEPTQHESQKQETLDLDDEKDDDFVNVKMELEFVNEKETDDEEGEVVQTFSPSGGGVGVKSRSPAARRSSHIASSISSKLPPSFHTDILEAWLPYVYLPPSQQALDYLEQHWTTLDAASRARLDRRTLYAGLLMEWTHHHNSGTTSRSFLNAHTSQTLRATLSLATQPQWRRVLPATSTGIRLYTDDNGVNEKNEKKKENVGITLAMQETIACSLAHSLGAGMVILDDEVIARVRLDLMQQHGFTEDQVKPAMLIKSLIHTANQRGVSPSPSSLSKGASVAYAMQKDMQTCLDDPFDERAIRSWNEMKEWEATWSHKEDNESTTSDTPLPLVIFIRVDAASALLKSKSAVDFLLSECNGQNEQSTNLLILGKGVDANDEEPPAVTNLANAVSSEESSSEQSPAQQQQVQQQHPFFGFSANNQNASGQNDPPGSKRFNIFLARTVDNEGNPGIFGAVAPPQAGNLFPQMMAMQARERLQNMQQQQPNGLGNDRAREALERWAAMIQEQQQQQQESGDGQVPQFFNASLSTGPGRSPLNDPTLQHQAAVPPPNVIQETLQNAISEMLSKLAQMGDDDNDDMDTPELHRAFAQVLKNDNLRRGVMENLARAAPALSDPKCQGVMLSIFIPATPQGMGPKSFQQDPQSSSQAHHGGLNNMNGWFQRILNSQQEESHAASNGHGDHDEDESQAEKSRTRRVRTMAAAAAVQAASSAGASQAKERSREGKAARNLKRLETACKPVAVPTPSDPVRARSWDAWVDRELGSAIFRWNRVALNDQLNKRMLKLRENVGNIRIGSALRSMLSVRDITNDLDSVLRLAIEMEAENSQRRSLLSMDQAPSSVLDIDPSMAQLKPGKAIDPAKNSLSQIDDEDDSFLTLNPSTLESALSVICRIAPSPGGGISGSTNAVVYRTKEETMALAQDKHEKALVSQVVNAQDIGVTYDMIGGLKEVKELLRQSITYPLKFPHLYSEGIAREAVKGVLLFGPPGTGKTLLAKAVATEGGASFLSVDASSVENKWLGESEKNAKAVFTLARRLSPCVVFIDEVDSLLSSREGTSDDSAHGTLTSVKTTMMSEWDGLNSGTNGQGKGADRVIVVGSTNRPFDLDEAVLRRFPRRLLVDLPDLETRTEILQVTLAENRLDPQVNLTKIAERLEGYTGSDLKEVCREAVVQISHEHAKILDQGQNLSDDPLPQELRPVTVEDFERALGKLKKSVSETGRELARVWEWNEEYGEIKREKKQSSKLMSMYL